MLYYLIRGKNYVFNFYYGILFNENLFWIFEIYVSYNIDIEAENCTSYLSGFEILG